MAEELYFIKTNPCIAKINLYNKLCREESSILNYLDEDRKTRLEIIKNKVKDSIDQLDQQELSVIFFWLFNQPKNTSADNEEAKNQLFINGIELFYVIPSTAHIRSFYQILTHYKTFTKSNLDYTSNSENFNKFLIYGIFYTNLIKQYQKKENSNIFLDILRSDHTSLYSFAENDFNSNIKDPGKKENIISEENVYDNFIELYDLTRYYKGNIIQFPNH